MALEQQAIEQFASQQPPTELLGFFQPLIQTIKPLFGVASAIVGGLFGLYLIFIISRLYFERKKVHLLRDIRYDLDYLNQHFDLPYSTQKRPHRLKKVRALDEFREIEKAKQQKEQQKQEEKEEKQEEKEEKQKQKQQQKQQKQKEKDKRQKKK